MENMVPSSPQLAAAWAQSCTRSHHLAHPASCSPERLLLHLSANTRPYSPECEISQGSNLQADGDTLVWMVTGASSPHGQLPALAGTDDSQAPHTQLLSQCPSPLRSPEFWRSINAVDHLGPGFMHPGLEQTHPCFLRAQQVCMVPGSQAARCLCEGPAGPGLPHALLLLKPGRGACVEGTGPTWVCHQTLPNSCPGSRRKTQGKPQGGAAEAEAAKRGSSDRQTSTGCTVRQILRTCLAQTSSRPWPEGLKLFFFFGGTED